MATPSDLSSPEPNPRPQPKPRARKSNSNGNRPVDDDSLPVELVCPICADMLDSPMLLSCCGIDLCGSCVTKIKDSPLQTGNLCPYCGKQFDTMLNKRIQRKVNETKVPCTNRSLGCTWIGEFSKRESHIDSSNSLQGGGCPYQSMPCRYEGCEVTPQRRSIHHHETNECDFRPYSCHYCSKYSSTYTQVVSQHFPSCDEYPVDCPNECSIDCIPRGLLKAHLETECPLEESSCDYVSVGCSVRRKREEMRRHLETSSQYHNSLLLKEFVQMKADVLKHNKEYEIERDQVRAKNKDLSSQVTLAEVQNSVVSEETDKKVTDLKAELDLLKDENQMLKEQISVLKSDRLPRLGSNGSLDQFATKLESVEGKIADLSRNQSQNELGNLKNEIERQSRVLTVVDRRVGNFEQHRATVDSELGGIKKELSSLRPSIEGLTVSVQLLEDSIPHLKKQEGIQTEYIVSLQKGISAVKENISYIEEWMSPRPPFAFTFGRFSDHKKNKTAFVSPPFYTRVRGYKMCVRVDVGAVGGTYVGVYCCIMRGEHDEHLAWPFRGVVHIRLQNHLGDHNHFNQAIRYDRSTGDNQSGRVKTGDKNYLHGYAKFISQEELHIHSRQDRQFLKGDALDFEVTKVEEHTQS